jgi:outer membrane protein TolC
MLEARSLAEPGLQAYLERQMGRSLPAWPPARLDLEALTLVAFYFLPSLELARAEWAVAEAGVTTAGGRPNPVLTAGPGYNFSVGAGGPTPWIPFANLDLPLETAGKRGHRVARAKELAEAARLRLSTVAWKVREQLHANLLEHAAATARAERLRAQQRIQEKMLALLEQRVEAGAAARTEMSPVRIALLKTGLDLAAAVRQAEASRVALAGSLGLPVRALEGVAFDLDVSTSPKTDPSLTAPEARQRALTSRSDVLGALAEYAASQSALQLEVARQYPDLHLGNGYQYDQGEHKWTLGLSAELPVFNRNQGPIAEAEARRQAQAVRVLALQARIIADVDGALAAWSNALEQAAKQSQVRLLAAEQAETVAALVNAGAADALELAGAQLEAAATDLAQQDALVSVHRAGAQLEAALQRPIPTWPAPEPGRNAQLRKGQP